MDLYAEPSEFSIDYSDVKLLTDASPLLVGGLSEIDITPISLIDVERYLTFHPVIPRGIEIKANRMVSRGYFITGENDDAVAYCNNIMSNSGGIIFLKRWTQDTIAFGNGYSTLVPNKANTEIVFADIKHPVYFGFLKEKNADNEWQIVIDNKTKKPKGYSQYRYNTSGELESFGKLINPNEVAHLIFDRWGDELEGISIMQYLQSTLGNIINIENAGAQAGYLSGNPRYKFTTNIKDRTKLQEFANSVSNINERDAIILTEGSDAEILSPGITNFPEYHNQFLMLLSVKLGVPRPLLTMDGTSTNKATLQQQLQFLSEENQTDEEVIKQSIEGQIFEVACIKKFGENFTDFPNFHFKAFGTEEETFVNTAKTKAETVQLLINSATALATAGKDDLSEKVFDYISFMVGEEHDISTGVRKENRTVPKTDKLSEIKDSNGQDKSGTSETSIQNEDK